MNRTSVITSAAVLLALMVAVDAGASLPDPAPEAVPATSGEGYGAQAPRVREYSNSGCLVTSGLGDPWPCPEEDQIQLTAGDHSLHVLHTNATYDCCPDDIVISVSVSGSVIWLSEHEILTTPCDCICCYEVEATVVGLSPGEYTVVFCWFDYEAWQVQCLVEGIVIPPGLCRAPGPAGPSEHGVAPPGPGNVPPADRPASVGASELADGPFVENYSNTGCKGSGDPWPCMDDDQVFFTVEGNRLYVLHVDISYNCCLDDIVFWLAVEGNELHLTEEEIAPDPCYCICCYDAQATVYGLEPGEYLVELCWYDYEEDAERCYQDTITVP